MSQDLDDALFTTIAHIPVPCIISKRSTTEIVAVNQAAIDFFGYQRREELLALDIATLTAPRFRGELSNNYSITFDGGLTTIKSYLHRDGSELEAQLVAHPVVGHPNLAVAVLIDLRVTDALRNGAARVD
ncbi:MAG: PAS domain S-box protein [Actinomycetota bacterium]